MTAGVLVTRVIQQLLSGNIEERNKIAAPIGASDTTIPFTYALASLRDNSVFELDSELLYVWLANNSGKTVEVERGFGGTTPASHTINTVATVNPRFPRQQVLNALNTELSDLSSPVNGLFQMKTVDLAYNGSDRMVNLTGVTDIQDIYDVRYRYQNDDYPIVRNVRLLTNMPTSDFPSGNALAFDASVRSGTVRVLYKAPFGSFSSEASTITSAGVTSNLEDLVVLGAQIRMMAGREIKRNFLEAQGDTRRSDEVPAGAITNSMLGLQRLRAQRIVAESARLARQYPLRIRK